jgi:hypothetical protein
LKERIFILGLAYLADIFNHINEANLSIQGPEDTIMDPTENLQALLANLSIWKKRVEADIVANFKCWRKCFTKMELRYKILYQFF